MISVTQNAYFQEKLIFRPSHFFHHFPIMALQRAHFVLAIPRHTLRGYAIASKGQRSVPQCLHSMQWLPCTSSLWGSPWADICPHWGLPLCGDVQPSGQGALKDQVSMFQVTSGGGEPSMTMQSVAWSACSGVEAHEYYVWVGPGWASDGGHSSSCSPSRGWADAPWFTVCLDSQQKHGWLLISIHTPWPINIDSLSYIA